MPSHPPCLPGLAPNDFYLFRHPQKLFHDDNEIKQATWVLSRIWTACHHNSVWLASKNFLTDVTYVLLLRVIMLKNKVKILLMWFLFICFKIKWWWWWWWFLPHIELENFLNAPRMKDTVLDKVDTFKDLGDSLIHIYYSIVILVKSQKSLYDVGYH